MDEERSSVGVAEIGLMTERQASVETRKTSGRQERETEMRRYTEIRQKSGRDDKE